MSIMNKLTNALFGPSNVVIKEYHIEDDEIELNPTHNIIYKFGNVYNTSCDNMEDEVTIDNPLLFCKYVKTWTGENESEITKEERQDKNGNKKWYLVKNNNRIEDKERTIEIAELIKQNKIIVTTTLHISEIKDGDNIKYLCWDGQHRRGAIKILRNDIQYYSIIKARYICRIYKNDSEEGIMKKFISINKSVPVPQPIIDMLENKLLNYNSPTLEDSNNNKIKNVADTISLELSRIYSEYCRTSDNPRAPHFNIHNVNTDIIHYLKENELYDINSDELLYQIKQLNSALEIKYNTIKLNKKIKTSLIKVATYKNKCYLFIKCNNFTNEFTS